MLRFHFCNIIGIAPALPSLASGAPYLRRVVNMKNRVDFPGERLVTKLWEMLTEKGIGTTLTPWQACGPQRAAIRREELNLLAQAAADAADIRAGRTPFATHATRPTIGFHPAGQLPAHAGARTESEIGFSALADIALSQNVVDAVRAQINVTKAVIHAEEQLAHDSQLPTGRDIEEDWLFAWRDYAGKVSTEYLQRLWGSLLAGELKSPGTYSLRTLEFLKGLSRTETEQIAHLARYVVGKRIVRSETEYMRKQGISYEMLVDMQNLGVLSGVEAVGGLSAKYTSPVPDQFLLPLLSNGRALIVKHDDPSRKLSVDVYSLTQVGVQLLGLGNFEPDLEYLRRIGKAIAAQGFEVSLAKWRQLSEDEGGYFNEEPIEA